MKNNLDFEIRNRNSVIRSMGLMPNTYLDRIKTSVPKHDVHDSFVGHEARQLSVLEASTRL